jgi:3-deoxy-D-manno-octulosonate 8-phosphate phosphatase (KDO 8-P phosphatase)
MDVDGVLTDGTVWLDEAGRELKRVSFADIMGVSLGRRAGLRFALISGESGPALDQIAAKFGIADVYHDCKNKAEALRDFAGRVGVSLEEVCFIGDDTNDVSALRLSGLAAVPANAHGSARREADMVALRLGGNGAVREVVDMLIKERPDDR